MNRRADEAQKALREKNESRAEDQRARDGHVVELKERIWEFLQQNLTNVYVFFDQTLDQAKGFCLDILIPSI